MHDAVVIGGGPAGAAAAIRLARAGARVLVVEKRRFPRHKVCGEYLSPRAMVELERLGFSDPAAARIEELVLATPRERFKGPIAGLGLSRARLDLGLLDLARAAGAAVECGLARRESARRISIGGVAVEAARVVSADGRRPGGPVPARVALKAHFAGVPFRRGSVELYAYSQGYVGVAAIEEGLANVCGVARAAWYRGRSPDEWFAAAARENPFLGERVGRATRITEWLHAPLSLWRAPRDGVERVGSAAAFFEPLAGEGIAAALAGRTLLGPALLGRLAVSAASAPRLADLVLRLLRPHRRLFQRGLSSRPPVVRGGEAAG